MNAKLWDYIMCVKIINWYPASQTVLAIQVKNSSALPSWSVYRYMITSNSQSVCYQILELLQLLLNQCAIAILTQFTTLLCHGEDSVYFSLCKLSFLCNHLTSGGSLIQLTNISKDGNIIILSGSMYCQYVWTLNSMLMYWQLKIYNRTSRLQKYICNV